MKQLDPKAFWLFFLNIFFGLVFIYLFLGIFGSFGLSFLIWGETGSVFNFTTTFFIFNFLFIAIVIVFPILWAKLTYDNYKYELRDDGFRKESGVIWKRYVTIPYERIQNVDINRGIFTRMLGLSDLQIQTAGYSAPTAFISEGRLPGLSVQEADILRDELIKRAKGKQGL